ncbi:IclR family transcriptional regulator [Lactiplantibacillus pentosus]|uniref:IclR family transcriptional regulator n=1 Tax=Lactiplantibacillus pentosus TaxID=1589 RepID=UPI000D01DC25|nr:IclR family transcriptional regulator [Lactiplantibacillus pentosus]PRO86891.1 IclR family transcriptional regulator [Lactiplantibacillus pentosus]
MVNDRPKLYGSVLIKAKSILDAILNTESAPTLNEISQKAGINAPTTLKILTTLEALGFVRRDADSRRFYLGTQFLTYGQKASESFDIRSVTHELLQRLRDATGETVNLGVCQDDSVVLVEKLESPSSIKLKSTIGGRMNLYSSSMGKAILSQYSDQQLKDYFERTKLEPVTENTIVKVPTLRADLSRIRSVGFSIDDEENEPDIYCIGAAIVSEHHLYGAFSVSAPKYRVPEERRRNFIRLVLETQHRIQELL